MTDNEKLARWQGPMFGEPPHEYYEQPDYLNDDTAAMFLLDTLVEKDYVPQLAYNGTTLLWQCTIDEWTMIGRHRVHSPLISDVELGRDTRRAAVVSAVLELIERVDI